MVLSSVSLAGAGGTDPGPGIDPTPLAYVPDAIEFGGDTVFLLSKLHQSVFRWSISQQRYLATLKLAEIPKLMAYSAAHDRLYLAYDTGRIGEIAPTTGTAETSFLNLASAPTTMLATGEFIFFAYISNNYWTPSGVFTYRADGTLAGSISGYYAMQAPVWNGALQRILFMTGSWTHDFRSIDLGADGKFGQTRSGPLTVNASIGAPFRVAPDGSRAVFSNAAVHHAGDLARIGVLPVPPPPSPSIFPYQPDSPIADSAWLGGVLHTVRGLYPFGGAVASNGKIESWNAGLAVTGSGVTGGAPLRLNALSDGLLLVSMLEGRPVFAKYNAALEQVSSAPGNNPQPTVPITRANPSRPLGPAVDSWIEAAKHGGIAYFLFANPAKIERYDLANGAWLAPISLPAGPKHFALGASGIYVSFGKALSRFSLDGATETPLLSAVIDVRPLAENNGYIYLAETSPNWGTSPVAAADLNTGFIADQVATRRSMSGFSFSPALGKFFLRSTGSVPTDIMQIALKADGTIGTVSDSPYHGIFPNASQTFVFPGDSRVLDDAGCIYSTADLKYVATLGPAFADADFAGEQPVVLRDGGLVAYSSALDEVGYKMLPAGALRIFATNDTVISFAAATDRGVDALRTPLSTLTPPELPSPIDPTYLTYTPDAIELGKGGIVYLLSKLHQSVFRWSIAEREYLTSIPLSGVPATMAYSDSLDRLYLGYNAGRISKIDLAQSFVEKSFARVPQTALGLQTAGEFLFASNAGVEVTHYTLSREGVQISEARANQFSNGFTWSAANRRMYFLRDGSSVNDLMWELIDTAGTIQERGESPYHGEYGMRHPVRVAPDGSTLVLGNGDLYNAITLKRLGRLSINEAATLGFGGVLPSPPPVIDAVWFQQELFTVGAITLDGGRVQRWGSGGYSNASAPLLGVPLRLFVTDSGLFAVSSKGGRVYFSTIDPTFASDPVPNPDPVDFTQCTGTFFASLSSEPGSAGAFGGLVKLTLSAGGNASGFVRIGGKTVPFQITFDQYGHAVAVLLVNKQSCTLTLDLTTVSARPHLEGTLESETWSLAVNGGRAVQTAQQPSRHLFLLTDSSPEVRNDVPPVIGRGAMTFSRNGGVRISGALLLGGAVTQGSVLLEDGSVVLNLMTPRKTGFLAGVVTRADLPGSDWSGTLRWFNRANPAAVRYPENINTTVKFSGTRYTKAESSLGVDGDRAITVNLDSGDLDEPMVIPATLNPNGLMLSPFDYRFDYAIINPTTGMVRGFFMHPVTSDTVPFVGIVNSKRNEVQGGFLGPKHGGQVRIVPGWQ